MVPPFFYVYILQKIIILKYFIIPIIDRVKNKIVII